MALEDVHLDVLQNIEFAIVSVYRKQHALREDGAQKVLAGMTTTAEVLMITTQDAS